MNININFATSVSRHENGIVMPMLAVGMLAIVGIAGLALDMSHSYLNRTRLQNALDAAALSGALGLMRTKDAAISGQEATDTFNAHLKGEMAADEMALEIEFSPTLVPFNVGGADPLYIRVRVSDYDRPYTLSRVLPGIPDTKTLRTSAVAGPIPLGGPDAMVCDIAPLLICGDPTDTDSSDGTLFGIGFDDGTGSSGKYCLKASSSPGGNGNGNNNGNNGNSGINWPDDCVNEDIYADGEGPEADIGPGNFQLIQLECGPGGNCVRSNLAGDYGACLTDSSSVTTKPGNTVGPTAQGFNTRFAEYLGGMSAADYPGDYVIEEGISYNEYLSYYENESFDNPDGAAGRRVMAVPIGDCGAESVGSGQTDVPVLALGCFFMTDKTENNGQNNWIKGNLIEQCEADGRPGTNPDSGSYDGYGPFKLVLFKDPDNPST